MNKATEKKIRQAIQDGIDETVRKIRDIVLEGAAVPRDDGTPAQRAARTRAANRLAEKARRSAVARKAARTRAANRALQH